jgi:hypothetical protein
VAGLKKSEGTVAQAGDPEQIELWIGLGSLWFGGCERRVVLP